MNIKVFLTAVVVTVLVLIVFFYFFLAKAGTKDVPKANQPHPNSMVMPLHPSQVRAA